MDRVALRVAAAFAAYEMTIRVASRHLVATGYFNVGEEVLYGRWKNKRGRIVRIFTDDRGVPMIEIEPIPKGRKKNKTFSLFKIWKVKSREPSPHSG